MDAVEGPPVPPAVLGPPEVLLDERKHPDTFHWRWRSTLLGEDDQGRWLAVPPGTMARRGHEEVRRLGTPFVVLVPHDDPWLVECYLRHDRLATYVNIGTVPEWDDDGSRVTQVDLDLDVVRTIDGAVTLEDVEEFARHRDVLGYGDELVALAEAAARRAVRLLTDDPACFGQSAWLRRLDALLEEAS